MKKISHHLFRAVSFIAIGVFVATPFFLTTPEVGAAQIVNRSLTLQEGAGGDGGSLGDGVVNHIFTFDLPTASTVGSILFEYCTTAIGTCTVPTGLVTDDVATAFGSEAGSDLTGFSLNKATPGAPYLFRSPSGISAGDTAILQIDNITNPTAINETFFVRISSYASNDATGGAIDTGVVTASTAEPIDLDGTMPESLVFCTGATVSTTSSVPDCSTATAGDVSFNQLFSPTDTAYATSQMAASTNAGTGYAITVNGPTLTSGSNTITTMDTATTSIIGTGQFGLNLKLNTTPVVGAEVSPVADDIDLLGQASTGYDSADTFKFTTGDTVAASDSPGSPGATDSQIFTVSYIVNVPGNQAAGTYTTTMTYICTPTF